MTLFTEMTGELVFYFSFPVVRYAMLVGVLIALCSSLLGVTLVLKRFSFIGHGLSNVAFGATAIATAVNLTNNFLLVLPVTVISSVLLLRTGKGTRINGDAAIAMISAGALGIGYLIMNLFPDSANLAGDVCATLFGSTRILTIGNRMIEVWLCIALSAVVIAVFILFYHKIFAVTFDEDFSTATGTSAKTYNLVLAVIIAVVIVLAINLVGTLLISALIVFPALSAMRVFKSFLSVTVCSVIFSVVFSALGIIISILAGTPVGSAIVAVQIAGFAVFWAAGLIARR
jgi:zinc transport system permease protein